MEEKILGSSKIQKDGRLVIPKRVREILDVDVGDTVALEFENHHLVMSKA